MRWAIPVLLLTALLETATLPVAAAEAVVDLQQSDDRVTVHIGNETFTEYVFHGYKKPFFRDLHVAGGLVVTRSLDAADVTDHPHHKGLWIAVDEVGESRHWNENQTIRSESVKIVQQRDGDADRPAVFTTVNTWLNADAEPLLTETTTWTITSDRLIAAVIQLTPAGTQPVTFHDTKEGFFAVRMANALRVKGGSGKITNAHGDQGEDRVWGQPAEWVDYSGTKDGQAVGIALFDHPDNPRPSRYHVRDYGLFAISPFGESAYTNGKQDAQPVTLAPGEELTLRYAAFVHTGNATAADVAARHQRYRKTGS